MQYNFKEIIKENNGILFKIAHSYTCEKADFDDLYQEMLIQIWQSLKAFKNESKLSTWLYRVCLNTALSFNKNDKRANTNQNINEEITIPPEYDEGNRSSETERIKLLYHCIYLIKKEDRAIILLYLEGNKYDDISAITGLSTSNIGVKISRIKKQLYKLLKENGYERI